MLKIMIQFVVWGAACTLPIWGLIRCMLEWSLDGWFSLSDWHGADQALFSGKIQANFVEFHQAWHKWGLPEIAVQHCWKELIMESSCTSLAWAFRSNSFWIFLGLGLCMLTKMNLIWPRNFVCKHPVNQSYYFSRLILLFINVNFGVQCKLP